jgi:membrane peptidoglycan carboxypeptidase
MAKLNSDKFKKKLNQLKGNGRGKSRSGSNIRVNRNVSTRVRAHRDSRARKRAEYLSTLPKNPIKRFFYYWKPKNFAEYWFNRDGAIRALKVAGIALAVLMIMTLAVFAYFRKDLPKNITDLKTCSKGASTLYYDRTGNTLLWASSGDVECYPVKLDNINNNLQKAVISSEDKDFYKHGGFSFTGVARAFVSNVQGSSNTQGGSTITQQFVKNSLLTQERTITRKVKELILSIELERSYSKDEILNAYLNEIPFGSVYYGAEAAARGYFEKSAKDLTIDEAALMTAILPAPTYYSPYGSNREELVSRQRAIIDKMEQQGYITKEEAEAAKKTDTLAKLSTSNKDKYKDILAPYFVLEAQQRLEEEYGASNARKAGFRVTTTVDLKLQKYAEEAIAKGIARIERDGGDNAALVAIDAPTGQVLALVGGRDFNYPKFGEINYATTPRSPGSTFKPYDYASLMTQSKDWGAGSTLYDINTDFGGGYRPKDYDFREPGAMAMRKALGGSRNTPAIKAMYIAGIENTHNVAKKMGLVSGVTGCAGAPNCEGILSTAIGDGGQIRLDEHVNAFGTFSRMGKYKPITYVLKIEDNKGKTIKEWKDTPGEQALNPEVAYTINNILSDGSARYSGLDSQVRINGVTTAAKTGTTNNSDNGWLMGYSTKIVAGVWIGHHENKKLRGFMEQKTAPIWRDFFAKAHKDLPGAGDKWQQPTGMKRVCINTTTGYVAKSGGVCDIFPSWYQPKSPTRTQSAVIDTVSKKLATDCTPEAAKQTVTGGGILSEIPTSDPSYNRWMAPIKARYGAAGGIIPTDKDDVHKCDDIKPSVTLTIKDKGGGKYTFKADVTPGTFPLKTVNFSIDGLIPAGGSFEASGGQTTFEYDYTADSSSTKTIKVEVIDQGLYENSDEKAEPFVVASVSSNFVASNSGGRNNRGNNRN